MTMKFIFPFTLFIFLFISSSTVFAQSPSAVIVAHQQKLAEAKLYTLEVAEKMPAEHYGFRPNPEEMTFGEQLIHLADNLVWLSSSYLGERPTPHRPKLEAKDMDKEEVMRLLSASYDFALQELKQLDEGSLSREFPWRSGFMNKLQFLNLIQDHQTHHRAQVIVYLRLNQVTPPPYRGW